MKNYLRIILAVLLSISIWLIYNLSQPSTDLVTVDLVAHSNIEGRAADASEQVQVVAVCGATGFRLIRLARQSKKPVDVFINASDLEHKEGEFFTISAPELFRYSSELFGSDVTVQSIVSQNVRIRFARENNRKVPVVPIQAITYRQQYMATAPIKLVPDSVLVYGEPSRLESVDRVVTRPIEMSDVNRSKHGVVKIEPVAGVRLSATEATFSLEVDRFVEVPGKALVDVRNVPAGLQLAVFPSSVDVVYRCVFPINRDPGSEARFYVDYSEFAESLTGKCVVHCDKLPEGVIDVKVEPQVCECVVR